MVISGKGRQKLILIGSTSLVSSAFINLSSAVNSWKTIFDITPTTRALERLEQYKSIICFSGVNDSQFS